ncbi:hypothetical protein K2Y11_00915 [bacterium]|nr:hypothetical protein [bacterium]
MKFTNDSGVANSQVFIGFVGSNFLNATNAANGQSLSTNQFGSEHWYSLDTLSSGINLSNFSGRIYVCYGSPWISTHAGYEPSPISPADPNYHKRYDKIELTYNGNAADVADTTSIDYFSIPIELNVYQGGLNGTLKGSLSASPTKKTVDAVKSLTPTPGSAVVTDGNGEFVRVIAPNAYPPSPGLPASPYDNFDPYLTYLRDSYSPSHGGVIATIAGHFNGVGPAPVTMQTKGQDYQFTATIDSSKNIILTGTGSLIGGHTLLFKYEDLMNPTGIYGANPNFYLDGAPTILTPQNDIYGWMIGDLLAGLNIGAIGSTVVINGVQVGQMQSQQWFTLNKLFDGLQPSHPDFYNQWAAQMSRVSDAYNFAYSDRFAHVLAPLNPSAVDTLEIKLIGSTAVPEVPSSLLLGAAGFGFGCTVIARRRCQMSVR